MKAQAKLRNMLLISMALMAVILFAPSPARAQNTYAGGVSGSVTNNCLPKSNGASTIITSQVCDDGTTVTLPALTTIGGSSVAGLGTITSASATAFAVGLNGATNPAFVVDSSTGTQAAGLSVKGATSSGTVAVAVISSGGAANLTVNAKGTGTIGIGSVSTGAVTITPVTTVTGALTTSGGIVNTGTITSTGAINAPFGATRSLTTPVVLTASQSGQLIAVASTADAVTTITLPAASTAGLRYCFAADSVSGSNREIDVEPPAGSDLIIGTTNPAGATGIATTAGAGHGIKNTHATAVRGNAVCLQSDGVNTWYMTSLVGTWAAY